MTAFIVSVAVTGACLYYQKWEPVLLIAGAAISYLFPKKQG